jgi:hypothetical protein
VLCANRNRLAYAGAFVDQPRHPLLEWPHNPTLDSKPLEHCVRTSAGANNKLAFVGVGKTTDLHHDVEHRFELRQFLWYAHQSNDCVKTLSQRWVADVVS